MQRLLDRTSLQYDGAAAQGPFNARGLQGLLEACPTSGSRRGMYRMLLSPCISNAGVVSNAVASFRSVDALLAPRSRSILISVSTVMPALLASSLFVQPAARR